jgi:hypothetical protein
MIELIQKLALPFLALCWAGGIVAMARSIFRIPARARQSREGKTAAPSLAKVHPKRQVRPSARAVVTRRPPPVG